MDTAAPLPADAADEFMVALTRAVAGLGLESPPLQQQRMWQHFLWMTEANRHFNLTRITSPANAAVKHYADSLTLLCTPWVDATRRTRVLDLGTGAGFPAVPLAMACAAWKVTAIDGTGKKARFVAEAVTEIGLQNLDAIHARAADLSKTHRGVFDLILVRAVGKIAPMLVEAAPMLAADGAIVFYKTASMPADELRDAEKAAHRLHLQGPQVHSVGLTAADEPLPRRLIRYARA